MSIQNALGNTAAALAARAITPEQIKAMQAHILTSMNNNTLEAYKAVPILQDLNSRLQQVQNAPAMAQAALNQPPISAQVMQQARADLRGPSAPMQMPPPQMPPQQPQPQAAPQQPQGIDSAQSNLPQSYANGGIIAFDDGGAVNNDWMYARGPYGYTAEQMAAQEQAKKAAQNAQVMQANKTAGTSYALPYSTDPKTGLLTSSLSPTPAPTPAPAPAAPAPAPAAPAPAAPAVGKGIDAAPGAAKAPKKVADAVKSVEKNAAPAAPADPTATPGIDSAPAVASAATAAPAWGDMYKQSEWDAKKESLENLIKGQSDESKQNAELNMWLALMKGGAKMMGGTSPNFAANMGAGAEETASGIAAALQHQQAEKAAQVQQLVNLGLKAPEIDIGLTKADTERRLGQASAAHLGAETKRITELTEPERQQILAQTANLRSEIKARNDLTPYQIKHLMSQVDLIEKGQIPYYQGYSEYRKAAGEALGSKGAPTYGSVSFSDVQKFRKDLDESMQGGPKAILNSAIGQKIPPADDPKYGFIRKGLEAKPGTTSYNNAMSAIHDMKEKYIQDTLTGYAGAPYSMKNNRVGSGAGIDALPD